VKVTAVGDCGVDRYLNLRADRPGGISLNFAVNARRCFAASDEIRIVTALGDDGAADLVRRTMERFSLVGFVATRPGRTPVQYIDRAPSGEKIFTRYEAGVLGSHRIDRMQRAAVRESDLLIVAVYRQVLALVDSVARTASRAMRAFDFGALLHHPDPVALVERYASDLDIAFFGLAETESELIAAVARTCRAHACLAVVTLGAGGSLAFTADHCHRCPAAPVAEVVDTTGAGDAFAAGFLGEYVRSADPAASLRCGAGAAAQAVTRVGAFEAEMTPWPDGREPI
jgi:sugar/nucleoside kinase (ribokinase family)